MNIKEIEKKIQALNYDLSNLYSEKKDRKQSLAKNHSEIQKYNDLYNMSEPVRFKTISKDELVISLSENSNIWNCIAFDSFNSLVEGRLKELGLPKETKICFYNSFGNRVFIELYPDSTLVENKNFKKELETWRKREERLKEMEIFKNLAKCNVKKINNNLKSIKSEINTVESKLKTLEKYLEDSKNIQKLIDN